MASKMEFETVSPYKADSPLSYDMVEGELSSGSGRSSPETVRNNASECSTQTDEYNETITSMRVEVNNSTTKQQLQTAINQPTPQELACIIAEKTVRPKVPDVSKNLESFRTRKYNTITEQNTSTHSDQNNRPLNNNSKPSETYSSPPMPNYPPPARPPPPKDYSTTNHRMQHRVQQRLFERNSHHIRPNNLRFPYALTTRSRNKKSFFHQSTNEQTPTSIVMETIWFHKMDPKNFNNPHSSNYNPLLSCQNSAEKPFEPKNYNFVLVPLHTLKDRIPE